MKKLLLMGLTMFILLALAACNGNGGAYTTTSETQESDSTAAATTPATDTQPMFKNYYTFGDTLIITIGRDPEWEVIFFDGIVVTEQLSPARTPRDDASARTWQSYEITRGREVIAMPARVTNISGGNRPQGMSMSYIAYSPVRGGEGQEEAMTVTEFSAIRNRMIDSEASFPSVHVGGMEAGDYVYGYIFLIYEGDGDYWVRWPWQDLNVRIPVSR